MFFCIFGQRSVAKAWTNPISWSIPLFKLSWANFPFKTIVMWKTNIRGKWSPVNFGATNYRLFFSDWQSLSWWVMMIAFSCLLWVKLLVLTGLVLVETTSGKSSLSNTEIAFLVTDGKNKKVMLYGMKSSTHPNLFFKGWWMYYKIEDSHSPLMKRLIGPGGLCAPHLVAD